MTDDFLARLRADAERVPPVEVSPDRVFDHLARRRRRRLAAMGTTSALALVLGLAVVQPWAGERGTEDPNVADPGPSHGSWSTVSVDGQVGFECGTQVVPTDATEVEQGLYLDPTIRPTQVGWTTTDGFVPLAGAVLELGTDWTFDVGIVNGSEQAFTAGVFPNHPPYVVLARDGVVIGGQEVVMTAMYVAPVSVTWEPGHRQSGWVSGPLGLCPGSEDLELPGEYEVYFLREVRETPTPEAVQTGFQAPEVQFTLVGGPYPVTITDGTPQDAVEAEGPGGVLPDSRVFQCGEPVPELGPLPDSGLRLEPTVGAPWNPRAALLEGGNIPERDMEDFGPLPGATLDRAWVWTFDAGIVNRSARIVTAGLSDNIPPMVWFARDGRVVGGLQIVMTLAWTSPRSVTWEPGERQPVTYGSGPIWLGCGDDPEPPVPGDYEVYIAVDLLDEPRPDPDSPMDGWLIADHDYTLVGGPYPVTLTGDPYRPLYAYELDRAQGNRPGLDDLLLRFDGLGIQDFVPLPLGAAVPVEPSEADMIVWDGEHCVGAEEPGRWVSAYPEYTPGETAFRVRVQDDRVVWIELVGMLGTDRGVGFWSRLVDVQAAYPDLALLRPAGPDWPVDSWAVTEDGATMVFDIAPTDMGPDGETWATGTVVGIALVEGTDYPHPTTTGLCD